MRIAELELDLDVFSGPFDLLLTLVLREEVDLRELSLAEVVISYIDHLEARGELELEATTEFIVLVAALLELKSRLLLPDGDAEELLELEPAEAAEELLARMLDARRYLAPEVRYREAPLPPELRRIDLEQAPAGLWDPAILGRALGDLLTLPARLDLSHVLVARVSVAERIALLRRLLRKGGELSFDEVVEGDDRMTVAITLFALLELYKRGEVSWEQPKSFGEITVRAAGRAAVGGRR